MLHLIEKTLPAPVHRRVLQIVYRVRHHWRLWRKSPIIGCSVVVTDLKGDILMLRHSYGPKVWALPGGGLKNGEDPLKAAQRELNEELDIVGGKLRPVSLIEDVVSGSPLTIHLFSLLYDKHPKPDNREVVEARFFPAHSLPEPMGDPTRKMLKAWREKGNRSA